MNGDSLISERSGRQLDQVAHHIRRACNGWVHDTIEHPPPIAPSRNKSRLTQCAQVVRHERLSQPCSIHEVANHALAVVEQIEQAEPSFITQRSKAQGGNSAGPVCKFRHQLI